jgi:hypothetical protein
MSISISIVTAAASINQEIAVEFGTLPPAA